MGSSAVAAPVASMLRPTWRDGRSLASEPRAVVARVVDDGAGHECPGGRGGTRAGKAPAIKPTHRATGGRRGGANGQGDPAHCGQVSAHGGSNHTRPIGHKVAPSEGGTEATASRQSEAPIGVELWAAPGTNARAAAVGREQAQRQRSKPHTERLERRGVVRTVKYIQPTVGTRAPTGGATTPHL
jgi:hypothetical protein